VVRIGVLVVAALVLLLPASALATGTVSIEQKDGSAQKYAGVVMKMKDHTLTMTSADGVSRVMVVVAGEHCWPTSGLVYCAGGEMSLQQRGRVQAIRFTAAKFYFNLTDQEQSSDSLGSLLSACGCEVVSKVGPHTVVFAIQTAKGTHITGNGKLD
jgi:hypothetical protein